MARMKISELELRVRWYLGGQEAPAAVEDVHHSLKGDKWKQTSRRLKELYLVEDLRDQCTRREFLWTERRSYNGLNSGGQA
jgi:hypothetical protein